MSLEYTYKKATINDLSLIAEHIVKLAQNPEQHCIHSWAGESAEEVAQDLVTNYKNGELLYNLILHRGKIIGSMGAEFDEEMGTAWLQGPLINSQQWGAHAETLYEQTLNMLPSKIKELRAYLNTKNNTGRDFYQDHGFTEKDHVSYVYHLPLESRIQLTSTECLPLDIKHEKEFLELYKTLFPDPYYSGKRILEMQDKSHKVLMALEGNIFAGFVIICLDECEIQFLGVNNKQRLKGFGKLLLSCAINYLFDKREAKSISLNVSGDLENAQNLYQSVGFSLQYCGIGLSKAI